MVPRLAFLAEHYPPTDGGVATSAQRVARALVREGAKVQVLCFDHSRPLTSPDYVVHDVDEGVSIARVGPFFLKQKNIRADELEERIKAIFRRRAFDQMLRIVGASPVDAVLSFYLLNAGFIARFVGSAVNVPVISGVRGNDIGRNMFHVERFGVIRWVIEGSSRVVCVNEYLKSRLLLAFPWAAPSVSVVPNSVALDDPTCSRESSRQRLASITGWDPRDLWATFIGNLREKKGIAQLIAAMAALPAGSPVRLLVVGPEPNPRERLLCGDNWATLQGQGRIHVTGQVSRDEVPLWIKGCDVVLMPSLDDGMANGLLEGMAAGLCPVATTIFADTIAPDSGVLVAPGSPAALTAALESLAADRQRVRLLGDAARQRVMRFGPADEAKAYLSLVAEAVRSPVALA